ncbi:MAG: hypothetical protein JXQ75_15455 [Phycisphaerae bacterium]|nr:hypothetical protein [Phycisphaerae bacterium]
MTRTTKPQNEVEAKESNGNRARGRTKRQTGDRGSGAERQRNDQAGDAAGLSPASIAALVLAAVSERGGYGPDAYVDISTLSGRIGVEGSRIIDVCQDLQTPHFMLLTRRAPGGSIIGLYAASRSWVQDRAECFRDQADKLLADARSYDIIAATMEPE